MSKSKDSKKEPKPYFVVKLKILPHGSLEKFLDTRFDICNRIYNAGRNEVYKQLLRPLFQDCWFQCCIHECFKTKNKTERKEWYKEIYNLLDYYDVHEYTVIKIFDKVFRESYKGSVNSSVVQHLASELWKSIESHIFRRTKIKRRRIGSTVSMTSKRADTGIIYNETNFTVKIMGHIFNLEPVKANDTYLQYALNNKVKYCAVKREPSKRGWRYILLITMEGISPAKKSLGKGTYGIDLGTSTVAYYNDNSAGFETLAPQIVLDEENIKHWARVYERRRHLNNPDCYNEDGTIKKGSRFKQTKGSLRALQKLKYAYALKREHTLRYHNFLINQIAEACDAVIIEPMDFRALAKRASDRSKADKKKNETKTTAKTIETADKAPIKKNKRKRRFGRSINKYSPGNFASKLKAKITVLGGTVVEVNIKEYKASQYNHVTREAIKPKLSDRSKIVDGHLVQRDLYSAFLLANYKDTETIDFDKCNNSFSNYLKLQDQVIAKVKAIKNPGPAYKNFGI